MLTLLRDLLNELRHGARRLARRPAFTILGGVLCAAATGATLTLFAVVKAVLLDPLPLPAAERLVAVWCTVARFDLSEYPYSWPNFADTRAALRSFEGLVATRNASFTLAAAEEPVLVDGARVSRDLLRTLGARPALGADFGEDAPVESVLLGDELWRTRFGGDPGIVGRAVVLDGSPHTVVGVLPAGLRLPDVGSDLLVPFEPRGPEERREFHFLRVFGRLRAGTTVEAGAAELLAASERLAQEYPDANRDLRARLVPLREQMVGQSRGSPRWRCGRCAGSIRACCRVPERSRSIRLWPLRPCSPWWSRRYCSPSRRRSRRCERVRRCAAAVSARAGRNDSSRRSSARRSRCRWCWFCSRPRSPCATSRCNRCNLDSASTAW